MGKSRKRKLRHGTRDYAKPKEAVTLPGTSWDKGPDTPAQRERKITEDRGEIDAETGKVINPNGVKGARRQTVIERYRVNGWVNDTQLAAGLRLCELSQGVRARDPLEAIGDVRGSGGGDPAAAAVDRRAEFHRVWKQVSERHRPVIERAVLEDRAVTTMSGDVLDTRLRKARMAMLRDGLDEVAMVLEGRNKK